MKLPSAVDFLCVFAALREQLFAREASPFCQETFHAKPQSRKVSKSRDAKE
jgi:hypothetical protein